MQRVSRQYGEPADGGGEVVTHIPSPRGRSDRHHREGDTNARDAVSHANTRSARENRMRDIRSPTKLCRTGYSCGDASFSSVRLLPNN
jgi:hypothetical protein